MYRPPVCTYSSYGVETAAKNKVICQSNAIQEDFPEYVLLENLKADTVVNFIGIKVGDVNGTAVVD